MSVVKVSLDSSCLGLSTDEKWAKSERVEFWAWSGSKSLTARNFEQDEQMRLVFRSFDSSGLDLSTDQKWAKSERVEFWAWSGPKSLTARNFEQDEQMRLVFRSFDSSGPDLSTDQKWAKSERVEFWAILLGCFFENVTAENSSYLTEIRRYIKGKCFGPTSSKTIKERNRII